MADGSINDEDLLNDYSTTARDNVTYSPADALRHQLLRKPYTTVAQI